MRLRTCLLIATMGALTACSSTPPAPEWQMNAKTSADRATEAWLVGDARIEAVEFARARREITSTGRADTGAAITAAKRSGSPRSTNPPDFSDRYMKRLRKILRPFFKVYDADNSNSLQIEELRVLFEDMGEKLTRAEVGDLFAKFDTDKNGSIDYEEFVQGVCDFILNNQAAGSGKYHHANNRQRGMSNLSHGVSLFAYFIVI